MSDHKAISSFSRMMRVGCGFIALCGLIGGIGALVGMAKNTSEFFNFFPLIALPFFCTYLFGYMAIKGKHPGWIRRGNGG